MNFHARYMPKSNQGEGRASTRSRHMNDLYIIASLLTQSHSKAHSQPLWPRLHNELHQDLPKEDSKSETQVRD